MALKGYIDRQAGRDRLKQQLLDQHGQDWVPLGGWDEWFGPDNPTCDAQCTRCGRMVPEVRPFGDNGASICEDCAAADPKALARIEAS